MLQCTFLHTIEQHQTKSEREKELNGKQDKEKPKYTETEYKNSKNNVKNDVYAHESVSFDHNWFLHRLQEPLPYSIGFTTLNMYYAYEIYYYCTPCRA